MWCGVYVCVQNECKRERELSRDLPQCLKKFRAEFPMNSASSVVIAVVATATTVITCYYRQFIHQHPEINWVHRKRGFVLEVVVLCEVLEV